MKLNIKNIISRNELNEIKSNIDSVKSEIKELKSDLIQMLIIEGVDDPGILKCVFMAGGPGCFVARTLVRTEFGYKPIEELNEGELVYTINEETGIEELKPILVTHKYDNHTDDLLELEFEDGTIVRCTENHKFYVDGKWIPAKDLIVY